MPRAATHTASGTAGAQIEQRSTGMHAASHGTVHARAATHTASGSAGAYVDRKIDGHTCFVKRDGTCLEPPLIRRVDGRRSYLSARGIRGWHAGRGVRKGRYAGYAATPTLSGSDGAHGPQRYAACGTRLAGARVRTMFGACCTTRRRGVGPTRIRRMSAGAHGAHTECDERATRTASDSTPTSRRTARHLCTATHATLGDVPLAAGGHATHDVASVGWNSPYDAPNR